jgi:hypothetical protein
MYGQAKKAYLNMENYLKSDEDTKPVGKTSGLLGRNKQQDIKEDMQDNPTQRMANLVQRIRKARMEIKNNETTSA